MEESGDHAKQNKSDWERRVSCMCLYVDFRNNNNKDMKRKAAMKDVEAEVRLREG